MLQKRIDLWKSALPTVKPFYAVKCNNLPAVLRTLSQSGAGFDCASSDEFERVRGSEIIYANPCKSRKELVKAAEEGIRYTTFDSLSELEKIQEVIPNAKPVLRIHVDDKGGSRIPLNKKFGLCFDHIDTILFRQQIYGIAFHVGSDCSSVLSYKSAFDTVKQFMSLLGGNPAFRPEVLDIGGGFSGNSDNDSFFTDIVAPLIRKEISTLPFKRVIAEPGRFFAEESCSLYVEVIGKKILPDGTESITVDESVYGLFSGVLFDGFKPKFTCITKSLKEEMKPYTIFGRTCDSADRIAEQIWLPSSIAEGDIIEVPSIGAYSYVSASEFNGFPRSEVQELL
jgi:ornithine decarboxylase